MIPLLEDLVADPYGENSSRNSNNSLSWAEERAVNFRMMKNAYHRLVIGPAQAFGTGCVAVFGIGCLEGMTYLAPSPSTLVSTTTSTSTTTSNSTQASHLFFHKLKFVVRYGASQIIPAVIWGRQSASTVAEYYGMTNALKPILIPDSELSPRQRLATHRLLAIRGAIAGTVLLSQVFSLVDVTQQAKADYSRHIHAGLEPPLLVANNSKTKSGVVVRLAGKNSDVTNLGMLRDGRRRLFPIFEDASVPGVLQIMRQHGVKRGSQQAVPLFWQVNNGQYGHADTWKEFNIPTHWLFEMMGSSRNDRSSGSSSTSTAEQQQQQQQQQPTSSSEECNKLLLILEADATSDKTSDLSLAPPQEMSDSDLDLYEVAQGFYQLEQRLTIPSKSTLKSNITSSRLNPASAQHKTLRVVLVDSQSILTRGGGRTTTVKAYINKLGLADIIIDARAPLLFAVVNWLEQKAALRGDYRNDGTTATSRTRGATVPKSNVSYIDAHTMTGILQSLWENGNPTKGSHRQDKVVILETPEQDLFRSIQGTLEQLGYNVMDIEQAVALFGTTDNIPTLVYEKTTHDTIHTIRRLVEQKIARRQDVCAMCPRHQGLVERGDENDNNNNNTEVASICSSDIYDRLFRSVRNAARNGQSYDEIQRELDENSEAFLVKHDSHKKRLCVNL